jgi:hypothetical protein
VKDLGSRLATIGAICCFALAVVSQPIEGLILAVAAVVLFVRTDKER